MYKQIIDFINKQLDLKYGSMMAKRKAFAEELGYSEWTVSHILDGSLNPSKHFMECISEYFGKAIVYYNGQWKIVNADR